MTQSTRQKIFLVGMMGVGKTMVGRHIAQKLEIRLIDNDLDMAERTGSTIDGLALLPIEQLHELELGQAQFLLDEAGPFVAGLAASIGDHFTVLNQLQREGQVIYLRADVKTLTDRFQSGHVGRQNRVSDHSEFIRNAFDRRDPAFYECADYVIEADQPVETVLREIDALLPTLAP
jgi:shikimate kinase